MSVGKFNKYVYCNSCKDFELKCERFLGKQRDGNR